MVPLYLRMNPLPIPTRNFHILSPNQTASNEHVLGQRKRGFKAYPWLQKDMAGVYPTESSESWHMDPEMDVFSDEGTTDSTIMDEGTKLSRRMRRLIEREFKDADPMSYEKKLDKVFRKRNVEKGRRGF